MYGRLMTGRRTIVLGLGALFALAIAGTALADNTDLDSDGVAAFTSNGTLALGDRCIGTSYSSNVLVAINRNGSYSPGTQVFKKGTTATVSAPADTSAELSETVPDSSIQIPADWDLAANNVKTSDTLGVPAGTGTVAVQLVPSSLGAKTATVTVRASGTNPSDAAIQRDVSLTVTWTGIACTPANTAPTVTYVTPPSTADEGDTKTFNFTISDPDVGDTFSFVAGYPNCGNGGSLVSGTASITGTAGTFQCSFADGPATPSVTVKVKDAADAASNEAVAAVSIANVAPTATLSNNGPVNEGSAASITFSSPQDPSSADTAAGFHYAYSCSNGDLSATTYASAGTTASISCTFSDNGSFVVKGRVIDKDDGSTEYTTAVSVANVAPTIALSGAATTDEGAAYTLTLGTVVDPGTDTVTAYVVNWGDGTSDSFSGSPNGLSKTHTYADDSPSATASDSYTITVDLTDEDGTFVAAGSKLLTVNNVAPSLGALTATPNVVAIDTNVVVSAAFTDAGTLDTHTCAVDPDTDSTSGTFVVPATVANDPGDGSCSATVKYAAAGVYRVSMQVTDDDGGASSVSYYTYVVVYDPTAGFVTGGGWINATAGSYVPDSTLSGKGTFGFVAKYLKGATKPTGNTEFQFHAAGMNFASSDYQWLVVSGAKAQFKGSGMVNGVNGYGFLLTATDGALNGGTGTDKFRIKIWTLSDGVVVFDNNLGASDDIDAGSVQDIDAGSIVIHTPRR